MDVKILAIVAVVVVVAAGAGGYVLLSDNGDDDKKTGGLYDLDADILDVDMGGMSSTPKMAETIEYMYKEIYGDLASGADALTIADAKADTAFWEKYGAYTTTATINSNGSITYKTPVDDKTSSKKDITIDEPFTVLISTGTAYHTIIYYALCEKYGVEPYSDAALAKTALVSEFQGIAKGSLNIDSVKTSTPALVEYYADDYMSHCGSIKSYDLEQMGADVMKFTSAGEKVVLMGSATVAKDINKDVYTTVTSQGGQIALNSASSIPTTYAGIDLVGKIFGLSEYTDKVIEDIQLRLYKVYWSVQKSDDTHKAYFEGSSGKASKNTGSGAELCSFFGWDISLFDGLEHDTESLLAAAPDILIYYTNDERTMDEKMRIVS